MKPITPIVPGFNLETTIYKGKNYVDLPVWKAEDDPEGMTVSRWQLSWKERFQIFFTGNLWLYILTFNKPLQPVVIHTSSPNMDHTGYNEKI